MKKKDPTRQAIAVACTNFIHIPQIEIIKYKGCIAVVKLRQGMYTSYAIIYEMFRS